MNKKFIRVLGLGVGLFLAGSLSVNAQKVSFNGERLSLKQAFEKIESVSKYKIAYNTSQLDVNKQVVLNQKNQDVLQILSDLLKGTNCVYQVNDNYIVITLKDDEKVKKIKGTIKDSAGEPIIGANVILKGDATVGSITDIDGNFDLSVPSNATLQVSYIGYNTQDIPVGNKSFLNITLKEDTETLDEVVVVGYGSQKKVNLTGAVSTIDAKMLDNRTSSDPFNMLTGQVPGVTIVQNSGQPGADMGNLRVRGIGTLGNADAMVIIDGVESSINNVNPNDIASISVLKDAAASSIYGVRAANGVILITTKRGVVGKPKVSYNGYVGWQDACRLPKYLDSYNYALLLNEAYRNDGANAPYSEEVLQTIKDGTDPDHFANSNQVEAVLSERGIFHNHHLSIIGGKEDMKYSLAAGFYKKDGLMPNMSYNRFNIRSNIDSKISQRLDISLNLSASRDDRKAPATHKVSDPDDLRKSVLPDSMVIDNKYTFQYFPSDFRLWDPKIAHKLDKKRYLYQGESYYLPFEHTLCISKAWTWFQKEKNLPVRSLDELEELFYWCTDNNNTLVINIPPDKTGNIREYEANAIMELAKRIGIKKDKPLPKNGELLSLNSEVVPSSVFQENIQLYGGKYATDGGMQTLWRAADTIATLTIMLPQKPFNKISIFEACEQHVAPDGFTTERLNRIQEYNIEILENNQWKCIYVSDELMGDCKVIHFPKSYQTSKLRLNITRSIAPPAIYEINVIHKDKCSLGY